MMAAEKHDVIAEATNFCDGLTNVFMLRKRDPQTRNLLEKAKTIIEALLSESRKSSSIKPSLPVAPRQGRGGGGMGQLWVKLDELKRENEVFRRQLGKTQDDRSTASKAQGPGEEIISELHRKRSENKHLKTQNEKLEASLKQMEIVNSAIQDEYKRCKVALVTSRESMEGVVKDNKSLETNLSKTKTENDLLKQRFTRSVKPMVRPDNRQIENINERCRPSVIAMAYNNLESQEWMDAKDALEGNDEVDDETVITRFLCDIVTKSYEASKTVFGVLESTIAELLRKPSLSISIASSPLLVEQRSLPESLKDGVRQHMRHEGEEIDTEVIANIVCESLRNDSKKFFSTDQVNSKSVVSFMHACATITWQMVIQEPPMHLSTGDIQFDEVRHKLWWACNGSRAGKVDHFIWPTLYDYEGGNVLVKGCVHI